MDTNKLENRDKGQTMISDQSHRLIESNSKKSISLSNTRYEDKNTFPFLKQTKTDVKANKNCQRFVCAFFLYTYRTSRS